MRKKPSQSAGRQASRASTPSSVLIKPGVWALGLFAASILLTGAIRLRLLDIPLERDEGEYAYMGQLLLEGVPPYTQAYNMKLPGVSVVYALFMGVFGQTISGIHLGFLIWNIANVVIVFLLGRRLFGTETGATAGTVYSFLALSPAVVGTSAHATHFIVLPALAGILILLEGLENAKPWFFFASGLFSGIAFLMKQQAAAFILFSFFWLAWSCLVTRKTAPGAIVLHAGSLAVGVLLPYAGICLILYGAGVFKSFWFWTVEYAREYVSNLSLSRGFDELKATLSGLAPSMWGIWLIAAGGSLSLFWRSKVYPNRVFMFGFVVFSFLAVCPGLLFRPHYFIVFWPAVAMLTGLFVSLLSQRTQLKEHGTLRIMAPYLFVIMACVLQVRQDRGFYFKMSPNEACRTLFDLNPFPESVQIAEYIRTHSNANDRIVVLGSEPQIYFYARRHSATGHIYTYGLMEEQPYASEMQHQMIDEIERARPQFIIFINISASWLVRPRSDLGIFRWFANYQAENYRKVGLVDILSLKETRYVWDEPSGDYTPGSPHFIHVFRRKLS